MAGVDIAVLSAGLLALALVSVLIAPRATAADGFFRGAGPTGAAPDVWTLTLSQVTTWIFARSLMNAAILGYFFGIAGVLAYAAYYGSFLTGWLIVDRLRFRHGVGNMQSFLQARYGRLGNACFNFLLAMRLLTEVFANLLVVGIVFGVAGTSAYTWSILAVAGVTLAYSMNGGLRASLRTDVLQMVILAVLLVVLFAMMLVHPAFDGAAALASSPDFTSPGWVLLVVALLQVLSYPMHDPVMMDRGFIADRDTTRRSFLHAFWISVLCILAFGALGVFAGLERAGDEVLLVTLARLMGDTAMLVLAAALVISAASTMDSTFSSAAKLAVVDMGLGGGRTKAGRVAMLLFALGGLALVFLGSDDLFAAVAVSGTASLFLTPVIVYSILLDRDVRPWAFLLTFAAAVGGAALYFLENSKRITWIGDLTGVTHSYSKLLVVTVVILAIGFIAFALASRRRVAQ
ncbi:SLC5/6 family protein [Pseudazoarcus pumilus]|uniref:Sodium:proline symporter n=1 Tax=Pseudazoarcus pumilus TaxID=2067960 RepID=A0A2I6S4L7_9RHOO|nr:sodium:proline symporter [Pseudazoarcus pumilus]AUN94203.1 sodium:proline symporter [Pseudazoarcus pumilus]